MIDTEYLNRNVSIFRPDLDILEDELNDKYSNSSVLVVGGAGSIGQAVCNTLLNYNPKSLHVVDISENNLVELTRDIRSQDRIIKTELKFICLDVGSDEFEIMFNDLGPYDYIYNLSALKHVRSEDNPYTLIRMIKTNVINTVKLYNMAKTSKVKSFFCVSTDKAANPGNAMGASKLLMEMALAHVDDGNCQIALARFANVLFSDGSLPAGFVNRYNKKQPLSAPSDIKRYFISRDEAGELCTLAGTFGANSEIYFPKHFDRNNAVSFTEIAEKYLKSEGYDALICNSEEEAKKNMKTINDKTNWPCYFFKSNTTGEKSIEEFYTKNENVNFSQYESIGIISKNDTALDYEIFEKEFKKIITNDSINRNKILDFMKKNLIDFSHIEKGRSLNEKM